MKTIQTGLRMPETLYIQLKQRQQESGVPINQQVLNLVEIGLETIRLGIQEQGRASSRNPQETSE